MFGGGPTAALLVQGVVRPRRMFLRHLYWLRDVNAVEFNAIRRAWDSLSPLPGGRRAFSRLVGTVAPYTGTLGAEVQELSIGHSLVRLTDRRAVRNHLRSVHAVALANLVELTGNLAVAYSLADDARFIVKGMNLDYLKKARGTLTARCDCDVPRDSERREIQIVVDVLDASGDVVTRGTLLTLVGPKRRATT